MSEMTSCNYCVLSRIKERARREGKIVAIKRGGIGTDVYVCPANTSGEEMYAEKYFVASMMEITDHCCC
jgi:hypothetical protein